MEGKSAAKLHIVADIGLRYKVQVPCPVIGGLDVSLLSLAVFHVSLFIADLSLSNSPKTNPATIAMSFISADNHY